MMGRQFENEYRQALEGLAFTDEQKASIAAGRPRRPGRRPGGPAALSGKYW